MAAGRGARGLTRPGWRGRGRHGGPPRERLGGGGGGGEAHIRASEQQAGGGLIDIDPLARYEMAHWPAMAAACFTPPRSAWDWRERRQRRPCRKCRRWPRGSGRGALRWGAAGAEAGFRASSAMMIRAVLWPDSLRARLGVHY